LDATDAPISFDLLDTARVTDDKGAILDNDEPACRSCARPIW
jgi:hypothetical protein